MATGIKEAFKKCKDEGLVPWTIGDIVTYKNKNGIEKKELIGNVQHHEQITLVNCDKYNGGKILCVGTGKRSNLTVIDFETMKEHGLVSKNDLIKILGRGEIKAKLDVTAHAFTVTAQKAIEALGGSVAKL